MLSSLPMSILPCCTCLLALNFSIVNISVISLWIFTKLLPNFSELYVPSINIRHFLFYCEKLHVALWFSDISGCFLLIFFQHKPLPLSLTSFGLSWAALNDNYGLKAKIRASLDLLSSVYESIVSWIYGSICGEDINYPHCVCQPWKLIWM